jgi:hypothetical protein
MDPTSFLAGWDGQPVTVSALLDSDVPLFDYADTLSVPAVPALGTINLKVANWIDYYDTDSFATSTIAMSADQRSITLTLGGGPPSGMPPNPIQTLLAWTPGTGARTTTATPACSCIVFETGVLDTDF